MRCPHQFQYRGDNDQTIVVTVFQGPEGVSVANSPADPLHDQLEGDASSVHHPSHCYMVRNCLDLGCLSKSKQTSRSHHRGLHHWWSTVQHVSTGPLGLHDSCGWVHSCHIIIISWDTLQEMYSNFISNDNISLSKSTRNFSLCVCILHSFGSKNIEEWWKLKSFICELMLFWA